MNKKNPIIADLLRIIVRKGVIRTLILTSISVATAMACGWSYITDHSVRFNSHRTGRAFYRLPPLPIMFDRKTGKELSVADQSDDENNFDGQEQENSPTTLASATPEPQNVWEQAKLAESEADLNKARELLQKYLALTAEPSIDKESKRQKRRNSAYDMLDALTALHTGSNVKSVRAYLD